MAICDKCGKVVPPQNDATYIQAIMTGNGGYVLFCHPRHFLPTEGCEGSPSRYQYLEGQPRDTRGYPYNPEMEQKWRDAYAKAQAYEPEKE